LRIRPGNAQGQNPSLMVEYDSAFSAMSPAQRDRALSGRVPDFACLDVIANHPNRLAVVEPGGVAIELWYEESGKRDGGLRGGQPDAGRFAGEARLPRPPARGYAGGHSHAQIVPGKPPAADIAFEVFRQLSGKEARLAGSAARKLSSR